MDTIIQKDCGMKYKYEWDENKRITNMAKHGLDFNVAGYVLEDKRSKTIIDVKHSTESETRMMTIGLYKNTMCVIIIHTTRDDKIRIISFRHAHKKEEAQLWQSLVTL